MHDETPVYLDMTFDWAELSMLVENLSSGGALLMCPDVCESLQTGQRLREGVLISPEGDMTVIDVIVRWKLWPRVGVEFDGISSSAAARIANLLESARSQPT